MECIQRQRQRLVLPGKEDIQKINQVEESGLQAIQVIVDISVILAIIVILVGMKLLAMATLALTGAAFKFTQDDCPENLQVKCVDDFRQAYPICQKAAEQGGSDVIADLQCIKYFNKTKAECWPCICLIAKDLELKIKGCE